MLTGVLDALGWTVSRHPRVTVLAWALVTALALAASVLLLGGGRLVDRLHSGSPSVPGSESARAQQVLDEVRAAGETLTLAVDGVPVSEEALATAVLAEHSRLAAVPGVANVVSPWVLPGTVANPAAAPFLSEDGDGFLLVVTFRRGLGDAAQEAALEEVRTILAQVPERLARLAPHVEGRVGGTALVEEEIVGQAADDLGLGLRLALPLVLLVLVLALGGLTAAVPAVAAVLAALALGTGGLALLSGPLEVDVTAVSVVVMLSSTLAAAYGILLAARFREELAALLAADDGARTRRRRGDGAVLQSATRTAATAGRTVALSGSVLAVCSAGLALLGTPVLRGFGAVCLLSVLGALLAGLTLVPAVCVLLGRRLARPGPLSRVPLLGRLFADRGAVSARVAGLVQRRPWIALGGGLAVLLLLASPAGHLDVRLSSLRLLPAESQQREFVAHVAEQFPEAASPSVQVVAETTLASALAWAPTVAGLPGVDAVDEPVPLGNVVVLGVSTAGADDGGPAERQVVREIRALDPGFEHAVTGTAATQLDFLETVRERAPLVGGVVAALVLLLLALATGSLPLAVTSLVRALISVAATVGVLTWAFQDGHLSGLLGTDPVAGVEVYALALVVAVALGMALHVEALLDRVRELHESGSSDAEAVREGLRRSGSVVTAAAAVAVLALASFVLGRHLVLQEVGLALAVGVLVDATVVRLVLVPATAAVLGRAAWWSPWRSAAEDEAA